MKAKSFVLVFLLLLSTACGSVRDEKQERAYRAATAKGDILIGAPAPWTQRSNTVKFYRHGLEMAVDEVNGRGGVLGRKIRLLMEDDEGTVEKGRIIAQRFADNPDVVAVIGHFNAYVSIPVSITYEYHGLLMLVPTTTSAELTSRSGFQYIFRSVPTEAYLAERVAKAIGDRALSRVMVYFYNDDYGRSMANAFEHCAGNHGCMVLDRLSYDSTSTEKTFRRDLNRWKRTFTFDAIFIAGRTPQAATFIAEARRMGIDVPIFGGNAMDSPTLFEAGGKAVNGTIVGTFFHPDDTDLETLDFDRDFTARYGERPNSWAAQGYDAVKLLAHAMEKAGNTVPIEVARAMAAIQGWMGVTGPHSFDANGNVRGNEVDLIVARDGKFEFLRPPKHQ
ncbi:MAG: ABC transporter substrate-binding protein [Acidobacteriota bacterium]